MLKLKFTAFTWFLLPNRSYSTSGDRRVGARLLPSVQECQTRLPEGYLERNQLAECHRKIHGLQKVKRQLGAEGAALLRRFLRWSTAAQHTQAAPRGASEWRSLKYLINSNLVL